VFGVGAAAAATGVVIYFVGRGEVPAQCDFGTRTCAPGTSDDVKSQASNATNTTNIGLIIAISGAVVGVGGLVWHFVEPTGSTQTTASTPPTFKNVGLRNVTPLVGPTFGGAGFSAAF
jgi:hypothetical protein